MRKSQEIRELKTERTLLKDELRLAERAAQQLSTVNDSLQDSLSRGTAEVSRLFEENQALKAQREKITCATCHGAGSGPWGGEAPDGTVEMLTCDQCWGIGIDTPEIQMLMAEHEDMDARIENALRLCEKTIIAAMAGETIQPVKLMEDISDTLKGNK